MTTNLSPFPLRVGIDTGGTFTDFVVIDSCGLRVHKVRSTPDDPSRGILRGLRDILGATSDADGLIDLVHGSTVATNALLERKGARVALATTAGFEDVLFIGRQTRRELYNFFVEAPRPLVVREHVLGIAERACADGSILKPLDDDEVETLVGRLRELGVESVAVCLLHSYTNPSHEIRVSERLERAGFLVSVSSSILPEYREFERCSTTVVNAYVMPVMDRYLTALERKLETFESADETVSPDFRLSVMQSNGGTISARTAKSAAVRTILSGPAGGVVGAFAVSRETGFQKVIAFDMGGTSTDVSLLDGDVPTTSESTVGDFPVRLPILDIHTVGAGGGSIAYIDSGGALRVGPRSAGSDPGPACYGKGDELTVTDANLLLGRLVPELFFGGKMDLDVERAHRVASNFAERIGMDALELAEGVVRIADANMERAVRVVSVQRGFDPREFVLAAFGGAGGMHACSVAAGLDIPTVLVPRNAGVLSALGMLLSDVTKDYSQSVLRPMDASELSELVPRFDFLLNQAEADLKAEGFSKNAVRLDRAVDVRYVGQSYEITVPFGDDSIDEFHRRHARNYGYADPSRATEIVNVRVKACGVTNKPTLPLIEKAEGAIEPHSVRQAVFDGRRYDMPIFLQSELRAGFGIPGPALIAGSEATVVVPPDFSFTVDDFGNLVARRLGTGQLPQVLGTQNRECIHNIATS